MRVPRTADKSCQFTHCCRWMSLSIPNFHATINLLMAVLEEVYKIFWKRQKKVVEMSRPAKHVLGAIHEQVLSNIQHTVCNAVKLFFSNKQHVTCIITDALDQIWAGIATQLHKDQF